LIFNTIGIICEYNPFHFGHKYHIEKTREITNCENIVCIMSGSLVQRGDCAIFDKWQRAKVAAENGADLVIELPSYYVLQSADVFAKGAVKILDGMNIIDALSFGCETDNIDTIKKAASIMCDEKSDYNSILKSELNKGLGYPKSSRIALEKSMGEYKNTLSSPNSTLGISYVKALDSINSKIEPICIKRDNDYHSDKTNDDYMSASTIRKMILNGTDYLKYAPDYCGENIYSLKNAQSYILGYLRNADAEKLKAIKGYEEGLANLVINSANKACSIDEMFEMCVSKRYSMHRIRRYVMAIMLDINYDIEPSYIRVLSIGKNGAKLLRKIKDNSNLDIITKVSDYKKENIMFETDIKATNFASLCSGDIKERYNQKDFVKSPYIIKNSW